MKYRVVSLSVVAGLLAVGLSLFLVGGLNGEHLSQDDYTALAVCESVVQLSKQFSDSVWPGYDVSQRPFIFYMPGEWALLFNYPHQVEGFEAYSSDWPDLGTDVLYHQGQYGDLAGQLAFNLPVDTIRVTATNFSDRTAVDQFAFVIHENFHQFQFDQFGEIPWEREQKYPILDVENTALAYLEMRLLMDALQAAYDGDGSRCRDYTRQFVAVREHRWKQADPFVARYEQGQEINEGTAKYAELKSIELATRMRYESSLVGLTSLLTEEFSSISMPEYLLSVFHDRMTGGSISPEDMARNRIYPVGSAQGFLLDHFEVDWKGKAQQAGSDFTYAALLTDKLGVREQDLENLVNTAKEAYGYDQILTSTGGLIQQYSQGFNQALSMFESQDGFRMEINLSSKNLRRSRSSAAKKWLVDKGTRELCSHFDIYALESVRDTTLLFQLQDAGLLEENDWDVRTKKLVFFVPEIALISLDGKSFQIAAGGQHQFESLEIVGANLKLGYHGKGSITIAGREITIDVSP